MRKKRRLFRALAVTLVAVCCLECAEYHGRMLTVYAQEGSRDERIREYQNQIANTRDEREQLEAARTDVERIRNQLQSSREDLNNYVQQIDVALGDIQMRITDLDAQIEAKRLEIEEVRWELAEAIDVQNAQYEAMKERIRFMYERGNNVTINLMLEAGSFSEMLNKAQYIEQIAAYDRGKLDEYMAATEMVALTRQTLEEEERTLDLAIQAQEQEQQNLQILSAEKTNEIAGLTQEINASQAEIDQYNAQIAAREEEIARLQRELSYIQYGNPYDGGTFIWPCPSYTYISSDFGYRTGAYSGNHKGVDMAAPAGSPILAAYNGIVKYCGYSSSMGNYVWISHGSGLETIYMHASAIYVTQGQEVSAGDKIAAVGTTGWSTGNHLHFQVMLNGNAVTPWNYLYDPR